MDTRNDPTRLAIAAGLDLIDKELCPKSKDGHGHCVHWWDGCDPCCWCGDNSDPQADPER